VIISTFDGETDENSSYYKLVIFLDFDAIELIRGGVAGAIKENSTAATIESDEHSEITSQIMKELESFYGPCVHDYKEIVYSDKLSSCKFISGCPVGVYAPGVLTKYSDSMEKPTGRLFWGGTETSDIG